MNSAGAKKGSWLDRLSPDIFGSDVFIDYQNTYVWQANQVGHFAIGFAGVSLLEWGVLAFAGGGYSWLVYVLGASFVLIYAAKEYVDFRIAEHQAQDFFPYDKAELWADMGADTWFVASGALTVLAAYTHPLLGIGMAAVAVIAFIRIGKRFLPAKRSLDRARLPFLYRLTNFPQARGVQRYNADRIRAFIAGERVGGFDPSPAIVIQGRQGTGKSTLGIGIACEVALHKRSTGDFGRSAYLTAFGLFEDKAPPLEMAPAIEFKRPQAKVLGAGEAWRPEDVDVLVIDDVDSDNPIYASATAEQIVHQIKERPDVFELVRRKRTVWITGSTQYSDESSPHSWKAWVKALTDLYECSVDESRLGDEPADITAREPIPVIWLTQRLYP